MRIGARPRYKWRGYTHKHPPPEVRYETYTHPGVKYKPRFTPRYRKKRRFRPTGLLSEKDISNIKKQIETTQPKLEKSKPESPAYEIKVKNRDKNDRKKKSRISRFENSLTNQGTKGKKPREEKTKNKIWWLRN